MYRRSTLILCATVLATISSIALAQNAPPTYQGAARPSFQMCRFYEWVPRAVTENPKRMPIGNQTEVRFTFTRATTWSSGSFTGWSENEKIHGNLHGLRGRL
jgi:hypothetical protein